MKDLITIREENGSKLVSARELHSGLGISERFNSWMSRVIGYGFEENKDYVGCKVFNTLAKQELDDYIISLEMAKHIAMIQRSKLGMDFRNYFIECEKVVMSDEQLKAQLLVSIYGGGIDSVTSASKLVELEKKPLLETIAIQAPRVEYVKEVLESEGTFTITQIAKEMFLSGKELNNRLNELKVQYKVNGQWVLYANHNNKGYIDTKTFIVDGHTRVSTRWTNLGREFIHNLMKKEW